MGQSGPGQGPRDPRKGETRFNYFKAVQSDLNKRFSKTGAKKKTSPTKEK